MSGLGHEPPFGSSAARPLLPPQAGAQLLSPHIAMCQPHIKRGTSFRKLSGSPNVFFSSGNQFQQRLSVPGGRFSS